MKVEKIDHIHVYVRDIEAAKSFWSDVLGTRFTDIPAAEGWQEWKLKSAIDPLGIELVAPASPNSMVAKALERRGEGLAAISLKVSNIEEATRELEAKGLRVVGRICQGGLKEVQFHPKDAYGVMIELAEYEEQPAAIAAIYQE